MVLANLRLVVRIARGFIGKGMSLEDLISEGNIGLLRAVEGFDPEMETRFSTYATFWVKQSIRRFLYISGHVVRLPLYVGCLLAKSRRAENQLRYELGREASSEEVKAYLGLTTSQTQAVVKGQKAINSGQSSWTGDDEESPTALLPDVRADTPCEHLDVADDLRVALGSLNRLETRKAAVLRHRFGLSGEEPATLAEIGNRLGLTRERVRQIERTALSEIRDRMEYIGPRSRSASGGR
jgi:RNA polymerase primary sigma factor